MDVLFEQQGAVGVATLNRPAALNALTLPMFRSLRAQLAAWAEDDSVRAVVIRGAGDRAFCAGGDVRFVHGAPRAEQVALFAEEYRYIRELHALGKPYLALCDGITMGGGAGISVNGSHRIATERTVFAMPEVHIGSLPDVGATRFLNLCPGQVGMYLALTGARLGPADAIWSGLFTHQIRGHDTQLSVPTLAGTIDAYRVPGSSRPPGRLAGLQAGIDRCFGRGSVEEIVGALREEKGDWAVDALAAMERASPLSLKVVFRQLRMGRGISLEDALKLEYRVMLHMLERHDFYEGVRALLIDKDRRPRWEFRSLEEVPAAAVDSHFDPLGDRELRL